MRFDMNQSYQQKQIMSQKMIQAVQVLQMDIQELNLYIVEQYNNNPVLEIEDSHVTDWEQFANNQKNNNTHEGSVIKNELKSLPVIKESTFIDDLLLEWHVKRLNKIDEKVGEFIIYQINDKGYLDGSMKEIAELLSVSIEEVERVLIMVQNLEPAGIASRSLSERLIIQLKRKGIEDNTLVQLINNYLDLLAKKNWKLICKKLDISLEQLKNYVDCIKALSPVLNLETGKQTEYVEPEIRVIRSDREYEIEYVKDNSMYLYISDHYKKLLRNTDIDKQTKEYIKTNLDKAVWLLRNIEERKNNILNISRYIINKQKDFLNCGKNHLKPLIQKEVAEELGISISTVSRIVNGKYIETPQGVYELKYFFSSGIEKNKIEISATAIKNKLKEIIQNEDKRHPLSDEKIKDALKKEDISISRRTVAKYRISMDIPNASQRKEL